VFYLRSRRTYLPRIAWMSLMRSPTFSHAPTRVRLLLTSASPLVRDGNITMPCHLYGVEASVAASRPAVWSGRTTS
jgi:hypothetical protein